MNKIKFIINGILEILIAILLYIIISIFEITSIKIIYIISSVLVIICVNVEDAILVFFEKNENNKQLFNTYYINYPKVFEIAMLIDNRIKTNIEKLYKNENQIKKNYNLTDGVKLEKMNVTGTLENQFLNTTTNEYKEFQEIKNTNSIYLREVIKKSKNVNSLEGLKNGTLIKIDNVKLEILNNEEILQANSIISGAFSDNTVNTYANGQNFKINISSLTNMVLKDYKYYLKGEKDGKNFYIDIPMKAEKEFENEYSIYDLETGRINIVGIYRTNKYDIKNKTTFSKLQELGSDRVNKNDDIKSSRKIENKEKDNSKNLIDAPYIDLIAIIQDLLFEEEKK